MLLTWHNLHYYQELMAGLREAIAEGRVQEFAKAFDSARAAGIEVGEIRDSAGCGRSRIASQ